MNELVVVLVFILLPGILSAVVADKITVHSRWDSFKFGLYALILGLSSYAILQIIIWFSDFALHLLCSRPLEWTELHIWDAALNGGAGLQETEIILSTLVAVPVAFLAAFLVNQKLVNKLAQKIGVSTKYGDESLYSYYLNAKEIDWIYVREMDADLTYQGRIVSHSENDHMQEMVLTEVSVFRYSDSAQLYSVPSLYLSRPLGTLTIEAIPPDRMEAVNESKTPAD